MRAQIKYTSRRCLSGDLLIMRHAIKTIGLKVLGHKENAREHKNTFTYISADHVPGTIIIGE